MTSTPALGTYAWGQASGGVLNFGERLALLRMATLLLLGDLPKIVQYRMGMGRNRVARLQPDLLVVPDTQAAKAAATLLEELTPGFMINHSLRTYWFARLLGETTGVHFDDEALYVACLLHDIGFFGEHVSGAECFAVRGADAAWRMLESRGWDEARRTRVADAICLHANGVVSPLQGAEAHLLERGVLMDVTGLNAWDVHDEDTHAVFDRLPLLDQREQLWPMFRGEADAHRGCRGHFSRRYLGFGLMVQMSPWR